PFVFLGGKMSASAARPWVVSHQLFNYGLSLDGMYEAERITFVPDPFLFTTRRFTGPRPVDAIELARRIRSDPSLEATAPVDVTIGGATGLSMDVTLAPEASVYRDEDGRTPVLHSADAHPYPTPRGWGALIDPDTRMRIYVVDLPEGSADRMMAIAIGAPKSSFENVVEAAAPVLDSITFHAP
ncbi:MAG TPA: hypothetical protein VF119_05675, partial [Candidatus Limnocylindrales bacterium]